jgi:hypothetical protein
MGELAQSHWSVNSGCVHAHYRTGRLQKNFIPPSKIANRGGEGIPRCRCGGYGHGGGRTESLALVETGPEPTDSSVKLVLT